MVALAQAKVHGNRPGRTSLRTPQGKNKEEIDVIGSSCTWRQTQLDDFKVDVERDVAVRDMIPDRFFRFDHLEKYSACCPVKLFV
jgi:hypothetical protein